jgi:uncharacterized membrane protein
VIGAELGPEGRPPPSPAMYGVAVALSVAAAYAVGITLGALPLDPPHLWEALSRGSFLAHPPLRFLASCAPPLALALLLSLRALRAAPQDLPWLASPWRRLAFTLGPLLLSPFVLAQDDAIRRPALLAVCFGASVAAAAFVSSPSDRGADAPARSFAREHAPVIVVIAAHAVTFCALAILRDRAVWSASVDLGMFKEALWNTLHGRVMFSSTVGYSFLGEHFSPVLFLLLPFYALSPTSACLLVIQTLAVSVSAWPVYLVARDLGLRRGTATLLAAAMLASPPLHTALLYDFHMDLLAVPALSWLALALSRRRFGQAFVAVALLVSVKEDMFIPAVGALLAFALPGDARDRRWSAALGALAVGWCLFAMAVLLKRFGPPPGVPVYMSDGSDPQGYKFLRNFRHLSGPGGPFGHLFGQPVRYALWAFTDARLTTFITLLAPVGFASLLAGWRITLLMPLGIILLSDNPEIVALRYHYSAIQHPGVYLAAAFGLAALLRRARHPRRAELAAGAYVLVASMMLVATHPSSMAARVHATDTRAITPHTRTVDRIAAMVPPGAPVSSSTWIGPRFSNRPWGVLFPNGLDRADWVVVDLQRPAWPASVEQRDRTLLHLMRSGFGVAAAQDGVVALERGRSPQGNPAAVRDLFARRRYEVEGTEQTEFPNCSVADARASDGRARVVSPDDPRPAGWMVFGPFIHLPRGHYRVTFRLRARPAGATRDEIGLVDVFRQPGVTLARRDLTPAMFPTAAWRDVSLDFSIEDPGGASGMEFRVRTERNWELGADVISLAPTEDEDAVVRAFILGG